MTETKFCFNAYMKANRKSRKSRGSDNYYGEEQFDLLPRIRCKDGFVVSAQASDGHYCSPRYNTDWYYKVELGFPNQEIPAWMEYAEDPDKPTETVYAYVPVQLLNEVIDFHGGLAEVTPVELS